MLSVGLAVSLGLAILVAAVALGRARGRRRALAERVAQEIEPYLRRKAAEAGLPTSAPVWTARARPEDVVAYAAELAGELLSRERAGPMPEGILDTDPALARTMPPPASPSQIALTAKTRRRRG